MVKTQKLIMWKSTLIYKNVVKKPNNKIQHYKLQIRKNYVITIRVVLFWKFTVSSTPLNAACLVKVVEIDVQPKQNEEKRICDIYSEFIRFSRRPSNVWRQDMSNFQELFYRRSFPFQFDIIFDLHSFVGIFCIGIRLAIWSTPNRFDELYGSTPSSVLTRTNLVQSSRERPLTPALTVRFDGLKCWTQEEYNFPLKNQR